MVAFYAVSRLYSAIVQSCLWFLSDFAIAAKVYLFIEYICYLNPIKLCLQVGWKARTHAEENPRQMQLNTTQSPSLDLLYGSEKVFFSAWFSSAFLSWGLLQYGQLWRLSYHIHHNLVSTVKTIPEVEVWRAPYCPGLLMSFNFWGLRSWTISLSMFELPLVCMILALFGSSNLVGRGCLTGLRTSLPERGSSSSFLKREVIRWFLKKPSQNPKDKNRPMANMPLLDKMLKRMGVGCSAPGWIISKNNFKPVKGLVMEQKLPCHFVEWTVPEKREGECDCIDPFGPLSGF